MSKVTLTITDTDLNAGEFKIDFNAEGSEIDEGIATAAYFTAYYLYTISGTEKLVNDVAAMAQEITRLMDMETDTPVLSPSKPAKAFLVLEDINTETGQYEPTLTFSGGHPDGDRLPSAAVVVGVHMRNLLNSAAFQTECWEFAKTYAENNGGTITNPNSAPQFGGSEDS